MILVFILAIILYIVMDLFWFSITLAPIYLVKFTEIQKEKPEFMNKMYGGALAWGLLALGMALFVIPKSTSTISAAFYGFLYGLIVYGVYNGTNYVTFNKYDLSILIPDLVWGCVASMIVAIILYNAKILMKTE